MSKPFTIGITGGSGSGKTFFLQGLASHFQPEQICLISQDNYYKPIEQQTTDENGIEKAISNCTQMQKNGFTTIFNIQVADMQPGTTYPKA